MYCPKCARENIETAKFCRACGANLSLVPQALTGRLPEAPRSRDQRRRDTRRSREPDLARGIRKAFAGLAFLIIVVGLVLTARGPGLGGIWLLIPEFILLGKGIGEIVTVLNNRDDREARTAPQTAPRTNPLSAQSGFDELTSPPPSVTEGTTRNMDPIAARRRETN